MTMYVFLIMLFAVATFTSLFTEGIKKVLNECGRTYHSNLLAGAVAVALSALVFAGYVVLADAAFNAKMAVYLIAIILLSWLSAMVGYDKVKQAILQIKK